MSQKYSIMPHAIILFLFGLTLITVSPVFAEDSPEFVACQQIKPAGDFNLMKEKKNCFRDLARELESSAADAIQAKDATIADLESQIAEPAEDGKRETQAGRAAREASNVDTEAAKQHEADCQGGHIKGRNKRGC